MRASSVLQADDISKRLGQHAERCGEIGDEGYFLTDIQTSKDKATLRVLHVLFP